MHHIAALHILIDLKCKGHFSSASKHVLLNYSFIISLIYYFAHIKLFSHYYVSIILKLLYREAKITAILRKIVKSMISYPEKGWLVQISFYSG